MNFDAKEMGKRIRKIRMFNGYTQEEYAEKLNISRNHLARIEVGLRTVSIECLVQIANMEQLSIDFLILGKGDWPFKLNKRKLHIYLIQKLFLVLFVAKLATKCCLHGNRNQTLDTLQFNHSNEKL